MVDRLPPIKGIAKAIRDSRVRVCPICDAYEAIDRRIAVLCDGPKGRREAAFLQTYSHQVTVLALECDPGAPLGQNVLQVYLRDLALAPQGVVLHRSGELERHFDHLYLALGCAPQADLALGCGADQDEAGSLLVDAHQMTSVPGLYAAGDVVRGLNQLAVASGEAAVAATDLHNRLRAAARSGACARSCHQ